MIALTTPYLWYTTRATGFVTLALFTIVVTLGTLVANRVGGTVVGRFELNELHRSVSMVAMVFLGLHVATTALDSFAPTGWLSVVVPGASHYRTLGVALGAVAIDLMIAVWVSSLLKARVAPRSWRFIHWFSWAAYAAALVHAYATGTDARHGVGLYALVLAAAVVLAAATWRALGRPARAAGRTALSPLARAPRPLPTVARPPKDPRTRRLGERDPGRPHGARPNAPTHTPGAPTRPSSAHRPDAHRGETDRANGPSIPHAPRPRRGPR
ncbi:MAG TPA: hypothetical protein VFN59_03675 [Acidimicrobiales bacterium]|nr:hypothetical protein [Acidimicrobiales bacterium]